MADKVTIMVLKVDLQCRCCYKKIKKILCKFPQIKDQVYDEKANKVTITVVCCNPEKLRDKLCCKGAPVIKSIEIKEPPKPKQPEKPKEPEKPTIIVSDKPKEPEKPKVVIVEKPKVVIVDKPKEPEKPKEVEKPKEAPKPDPPKKPEPAPTPPQPVPILMGPMPVPVNEYPPAFPVRTCCGQCYGGYGGGPCYNGFGTPAPPPPCYDDYYGYGPGRGCHISRCDYYFSDENPRGCFIM